MTHESQVIFIPIWAVLAYYAFVAAYSFIFPDQWVFRCIQGHVCAGAAYALPLIVAEHFCPLRSLALPSLALCHHLSALNFIFLRALALSFLILLKYYENEMFYYENEIYYL